MKTKWLLIVGVVIAIVASFYYVIQLNIELAVLSMIALFALTNTMRARSFQAQGMIREARWMRILSIIFVVGFISWLVAIIAV